jgi:hypothetical protein
MSNQAMLQHLMAQGYNLNGPQFAPPAPPLVGPLAAPQGVPPSVVSAPPPHLAAFSVPGTLANPFQIQNYQGSGVSPFAHIHNTFNNHTYGIPGSLMSSMSAGLAPSIPGQPGPTLEQLLDRRAREWKPYRNAAEFKDALQDWYNTVLRSYPNDVARQKAAHDYVLETSVFIEKVGWSKTYEYHKSAFKAASKIPPQFDPLINPVYTFGYLTIIHPLLTAPGGRRTFNKSDSTFGSRQATRTNPNSNSTKRSRSSSTCSLHPGSSHSDAECNAQKGNKRRSGGGGGNPAPSSGESSN